MVFYGETIHLHRISERERNGEGKENGGGGKCSPDLARFELGIAGL